MQLSDSLQYFKSIKVISFIFMKKSFCLYLLLFSLTSIISPAFAAPKKAKAVATAVPQTDCSSYLVAEANSGDILDTLASEEARPPASMVKLMTAYVILKKIKEGALKADDQVQVTADASKIGGSQVYLKEGEVFTVNDLLHALLIQSANDAALALAQFASGSRESFVEEMNIAAKEIGMNHSEFHSPHGLPPAKDQLADLVSAEDFLILSRSLIKDYPEILEITKKDSMPFRDGTFEMRNHNGLLRSFEGTDGLKTGFYNEAGFCVATTAQRKGIRLIAVLMGCPSRKIRDEKATSLLTKAFQQYKPVKLLKAGESVGNIKIEGGLKPEAAIVAKDEIMVTTKTGSEQRIEKSLTGCSTIKAPVSKDQQCGTINYTLNGQLLASSPVLLTENVPKSGLVKSVLTKIGL